MMFILMLWIGLCEKIDTEERIINMLFGLDRRFACDEEHDESILR